LRFRELSLTKSALTHLRQHVRFYFCTLLGVGVFYLAHDFPSPLRFIAAGNAFFVVYLFLISLLVFRFTPDDLRRRAMDEDEGIFLVVIIMLAIIALCCAGIITMLNQGHNKPSGITLALVLLCAPLGWLTLHVTAAFHYADLFYAPQASSADSRPRPRLMFPGCVEPGPWEFLYYAFVVGMTAQVSDVQVSDTKMRRATLGHGVISFFFNTVLIAMAVNAVVAIAS
jgi:uncharacterized membrane protein